MDCLSTQCLHPTLPPTPAALAQLECGMSQGLKCWKLDPQAGGGSRWWDFKRWSPVGGGEVTGARPIEVAGGTLFVPDKVGS